MTIYTDAFGSSTLPPAEYGYQSLNITANTTLVWPYNTTGGTAVSKIMDVTATAGLTITLPDAAQVSTGEDFLIRNVGAESISIVDAAAGAVYTVIAGTAVYFYLTDNSTDAGTWGTVAYGVGTSAVDAATLVGYGIIASGSTLNQSHPVTATASGVTIDDTYRATLVNFTGGADTITLTSAATLGDNFFTLIRNSGSGTLTINPDGVETIDGLSTLPIQPSESLLLFCSGTAWFSVGYGRSVLYNFTQLVKDVSLGGTITLTSSEASNKLLTFTGNPAAGVTVEVPNVVAVYYILSSLSTAQNVTVKTAAGTGVAVPQGQRVIAICDSTNVYSAQSVSASTSVLLVDGSVSTPALAFSAQTNTGLYKYSTNGLGLAVNGADVQSLLTTAVAFYTNKVTIDSSGNTAIAGTINKVTITAPATAATLTIANNKTFTVSNTLTLAGTDSTTMTFPSTSGTVVTLDATQTLTNKTLGATVFSGAITGGQAATLGATSVTSLSASTATVSSLISANSGQITGASAASSGVGLELSYVAGVANVFGYNRTSPAFIPLRMSGSTVTLSTDGSTAAATVTSTGINSTAIGATTPSTGAFTTLLSTSNTQLGNTTLVSAASQVVLAGNTTAGSGLFEINLVDSGGGAPTIRFLRNSTANTKVDFCVAGSVTVAASITGTGFQGAVGATTPSTGAFTTLTTGLISSTVTVGSLLSSSNTTTNGNWIQLTNTGGTSYFGVDSSVAGSFFTSGGTAYDQSLAFASGRGLTIGTMSGAAVARVSSTGLAVTGTLSASGIFSGSSEVRALGSLGIFRAQPTDVAQGGRLYLDTLQTVNTAARNWAWINSFSSYGDCVLRVSTALGGDPNAAGTTILSATSTGLAVTGTLSTTGAISQGSGATAVTIGSGGIYNSVNTTGVIYLVGDGNAYSGVLAYGSTHATKANYLELKAGNATIATGTGAGLAVTGTLSATGDVTLNSGQRIKSQNTASNVGFIFGSVGAGTDPQLVGYGAGSLNGIFYDADTHTFRATNSSTNRMTLSSTGLAVTGTLTTSGNISTGTGTGASAGLRLYNGLSSFYGAIYAESATPSTTNYGIAVASNSLATKINSSTGGNVYLSINDTAVANVSSTGLAVTGTLSATGNVTLGDATTDTVKVAGVLSVGNATPSASGAGITFPATQSASTDANTLDDYREGSYTGTLTGCTTSPTASISYVRVGNVVTISIPTTFTGTSNATTCTITGAPAAIQPSGTRTFSIPMQDNGVWAAAIGSMGATGTLTFYKDVSAAAFTASGTKTVGNMQITYII